MEEEIFKILRGGIHGTDNLERIYANKISEQIKAFLRWKDHPKNAFNTSFNGIDGGRPKVRYEKNDKPFTIDELFNYFLEHDKSH